MILLVSKYIDVTPSAALCGEFTKIAVKTMSAY